MEIGQKWCDSITGRWFIILLIRPNKYGLFKGLVCVSLLIFVTLMMNHGIQIPSSIIYNTYWLDTSTTYTPGVVTSYHRLHLCTEGILNRRIINYDPLRANRDLMPLTHKSGCRLHFYSQSDMVTCFEALTAADNNNKSSYANTQIDNNGTNIKLHVAFIGDSRIRQIFANFVLQLLPFLEINCLKEKRDNVSDACFESSLMNAYVSFQSIPKYNDIYLEAVKEWTDGKSIPPDYLIIGSTAHHVKERNFGGIDFRAFEGNITLLAAQLTKLAERFGTRIVWWNDDLPPVEAFNIEAKYLKLNDIARHVFKRNRVPIEMWDSTNDMIMMYIKTCRLGIGRRAPKIGTPFVSHPNSWQNCVTDKFHAPQAYSIVHSQLLANYICNNVIST